MSEREDDLDTATVRFYLDKRDDRAGWDALDRIQAHVEALEGALREEHRKATAYNHVDPKCGVCKLLGIGWFARAGRTHLGGGPTE